MQLELTITGVKISLNVTTEINETIFCKDIISRLIVPALLGAGYTPNLIYDALKTAQVPGVEYITVAPKK